MRNTVTSDTVEDEMDLRLLARIRTVPWNRLERALDLACGTGRTGVWLKQQGVERVEGVDCTREMLALARAKGVYDRLEHADLRATGLPDSNYDLSIEVLADEHLPEIAPLYEEARRVTRPGGFLVVVGYHPHFLMQGIPTHFDRASGESVAIQSYVHLFSDHVKAAHARGWRLLEMDEGLIDEAWLAKKPQWEKYRNRPVSFSLVWKREQAP